MRKLIFILLCSCMLPLGAEVSVISVTDENLHAKPTDFPHTYEYFVSSDKAQLKCQATRLTPRWFATAAHCVQAICRKNCTVRMDLMDTQVSALAQGTHSVKQPTVFVHPGYREGQLAQDDFALIKLDVRQAPKTYFKRSMSKDVPHQALHAADFLAWLAQNPRAKKQYQQALHPTLPPVVDFSVSRNYEIDRQLSVISIFGGQRSVKKATSPVYYVKSLGYAYTTNFGIKRGMSGSGVMSNTGELVGIISSNIGETLYRGGKKINQQEWFVFPVFNESLLAFMQETMGSDFDKLDRKDAYPHFVKKTKQDFSALENRMKRTVTRKPTK